MTNPLPVVCARSLAAGLMVLVGSSTAHAVTKQECSHAYTEGQIQKKDGHLYKARKEFIVCSSSDCPATMVADCQEWLAQTEQELPTLRPTVVDAGGKPVPSARLELDGEPIDLHSTQEDLIVDVGPHRLVAAADGHEDAAIVVDLQPGEQRGEVRLVLAARPAPSKQHGSPKASVHAEHKIPTASFVLAGVAALSFSVAGYFAYAAGNRYSELKERCAPRCSEIETSDVKRNALLADIGLGTGTGALGLALGLYFVNGAGDQTQKGRPVLTPRQAGAFVGWNGSF